MKVKDVDLKNNLGKRIKIVFISDEEDKYLEGLTGELCYPFGMFYYGYASKVGVYLDNGKICDLFENDEIEFLDQWV